MPLLPVRPGAADLDLYRSPLQDFRALRVTERSNGPPTRFELRGKDATTPQTATS